MSHPPSTPAEAEAAVNRSKQARKSRRRFLRALALGAPAAAGTLAGLGWVGANGGSKAGAAFPGDAGSWRARFLAEARSNEATAVADADVTVTRQTGAALSPSLPQPAAPPSPAPQAAPAAADENILARMQDDLKRALAKPIEQRKWAMAIDLRKCIGCSACTIACKAENHLPPGVVYRPVLDTEIGEYPNVTRQFVPRPCMQCDDPPCVPVCPVGATYKRPDGIVEINYNKCIGCRYCIPACPYSARTFDFGDYYTDDTPERQGYEETTSPEYGRNWQRGESRSPVGNARKCQFCLHRLAVGMLPACVTTCIGAATYFGDKNDPDSLISELINRPNVVRLKEELGTEPKTYYLM